MRVLIDVTVPEGAKVSEVLAGEWVNAHTFVTFRCKIHGVEYMPSSTPKQKRTMAAIAHGWKPPKGSKVAKIPKKVARDFNRADTKKGRK